MARHTTIQVLGKSYFLKMYPEMTQAFGGDNCCSAIVSVFDFLKVSAIENLEAAGERQHGARLDA